MADNNKQDVLEDTLLEILVCPIDNGSLMYFAKENFLYNPRLKKSYEIKDSIPIMLADCAYDVSDEDHEKYMNGNYIETSKIG